ncbi:MAG TPA: acyl-CoA dehydrogenase family protein [Mycobacteriales bacterium]
MSYAPLSVRAPVRDAVRRFLADVVPLDRVREISATESGFDPVAWRRLATELDVQALVVPASYGGADGGWADLAVVAEEMGRALTPGPFLATLGLALPAIVATGDEAAAADLLPGIARGDTVATLAWAGDDGTWALDPTRVTATRAGDESWRLTGHRSYVLDGHVAGLLLVCAETADGPGLFAVHGDAAGLRRTVQPTMDQTRRLARLDLSEVPARRLACASVADVVAQALDRASILLGADMVGGAQACLDASVAYAREREQFGRPIGSFQAVKHLCAEMLVQIEAARSAVRYASFALDERPAEVPALACLVKALAGEAYLRAAGDNVQIHGGIGFTWEHPAHLYLKRARSSDGLFGRADLQRRALADRIGL